MLRVFMLHIYVITQLVRGFSGPTTTDFPQYKQRVKQNTGADIVWPPDLILANYVRRDFHLLPSAHVFCNSTISVCAFAVSRCDHAWSLHVPISKLSENNSFLSHSEMYYRKWKVIQSNLWDLHWARALFSLGYLEVRHTWYPVTPIIPDNVHSASGGMHCISVVKIAEHIIPLRYAWSLKAVKK